MPTYGYECKGCGEQFETYQRITDEPLKVHEACGGELRRLVYPVGIAFKGSGFYVNDYARKGNGSNGSSDKADKAEKADAPAAKADGGDGAKAEAKAEAKTEAKPEKKAESSAAGGA